MRTAKEELEYSLLTSGELGELLSRHLEKVALAKVIKVAMQRLLTRTSEPAIR
jgi:hypothetical protein